MKQTISTNTASQISRKTPRRIRGQGMTEYIIVVALVGLAAVVAVGFFGDAIQGQFAAMGGALSDAVQEATDAETLGTYGN